MDNENNNNEIIPAVPEQDQTWGQLVDQIIEQLGSEEIPERVIEAVILQLAGYSTHETAKKLGIRPAEIRRWISQYPAIAKILADHRASLIRWRMSQLERQFLAASQKSEEILNIDLDSKTVNPKILSAIGQHVRFIIGLFVGQKIDVHVTHDINAPLLNASQDALDYIATRIAEIRGDETEPIETTYRVVDEKFEDGPWFDENGQPFHGSFGVLDKNDDGWLCHICGRRVKSIKQHIITSHSTTIREYEVSFMLPIGAISNAD